MTAINDSQQQVNDDDGVDNSQVTIDEDDDDARSSIIAFFLAVNSCNIILWIQSIKRKMACCHIKKVVGTYKVGGSITTIQ